MAFISRVIETRVVLVSQSRGRAAFQPAASFAVSSLIRTAFSGRAATF